jgi:hypothetical protein
MACPPKNLSYHALQLLMLSILTVAAAGKPGNNTLDRPTKARPVEPAIAFQCQRMPHLTGEGE